MFIELQTTEFTRTVKVNKGTTFQLIGTLGATEVISFKQPNGSGGWMDVYIDEEKKELSDGNTMVSFYQPALIQISKPTTASNAGVMLVS